MSTLTPGLLRFTQFAVENFSDAAYLIEENGGIVYANEAAARLLGYSRQQLISMRMYDVNRDLTAETWPKVWQALKAMGRRTFEARHVAKDGRSIPVEISAVLMTIEGKEYSCAFARDIGDRRAMELRLRQAEKMEAIGLLAGGIAHDFNNQLAGIMGYASLLRRKVETDPLLTGLTDNILLAVNRAADLTNQLLAFSRRGKYVTEPVDVHKILIEVADMVALKVNRETRIDRRLQAERSMVLGDAAQLQSAILNLALNARDAMPEGGVLTFATRNARLDETFVAATSFRVSADDHVAITVADSGTGMDEATQARMFEPFFTTKGTGNATGLGLAAVYGTVKNHKGAITVDSAPGRGSRFDVYLPVGTGLAVPAPRPVSRGVSIPAGRHVLVVEDDPLVRDIAVQSLEILGCRVTAFGDGERAVEFYRREFANIDLVLLDMVMPAQSGRDTFKAMKAVNPDAKVLLASGYSLDGDAQAMLEGGVLGFIHKPYSMDALAAKLAEVLS